MARYRLAPVIRRRRPWAAKLERSCLRGPLTPGAYRTGTDESFAGGAAALSAELAVVEWSRTPEVVGLRQIPGERAPRRRDARV